MLYVPLALGAVAGGWGGWRSFWFVLAVTFLFIAREPLLAWWRARIRGRESPGAAKAMAAYLSLAVAGGLPLVVIYRLWGMIPVGLAAGGLLIWNALQVARREERTLTTEIIGIAGLTLAGPAAHYTAVGRWTPEAWWVWLASAAYFVSSVFYVRLRVLNARGKRPEERNRIRRWCGVYHGALTAALIALWISGAGGPFLALAYLPAISRAARHVGWPTRKLVLQRVGFQEVAYSLWFLAFAATAFLREPPGA